MWSQPNDKRIIWLSLFLLSAATLTFEINLTRLFSVAQFYHFAFMIVSIALLGFAASGTALTIFPALQKEQPIQRLGHWKKLNEKSVYMIDSYPIAVCDNYRIRRSKIYQGEDFRGYIASKKTLFLRSAHLYACDRAR